jgi:hypothetical protein
MGSGPHMRTSTVTGTSLHDTITVRISESTLVSIVEIVLSILAPGPPYMVHHMYWFTIRTFKVDLCIDSTYSRTPVNVPFYTGCIGDLILTFVKRVILE